MAAFFHELYRLELAFGSRLIKVLGNFFVRLASLKKDLYY